MAGSDQRAGTSAMPVLAPDVVESEAPSPGRVAALRQSRFVRLVRQVPFTASYVGVTVVLSIALGTLWSRIEGRSWYPDVAYGLPSFEAHRWHTLVTGNVFALFPVYYVFVAGLFAVLTGFAEWRLGTRRTIAITVTYQIAAVLGTALVFLIFRNTGWEWAHERAAETDVGFSAGMLAVFGVATSTVRPPWRLRLRLLLWAYVVFSILFVGQMADAEHLLAVGLSLPFASRLAGPRALQARALPTRHEIRLLAFVLVLITAASQVISVFLPDRLTPFGPATDTDTDTWYVLLINLVIALLVANGLRRGYRWAWWVEIVPAALVIAVGVLIAVALVVELVAPDQDIELDGVSEFAPNAILSLATFVLLIAARRSFRVPRRSKRALATGTSHPETAKRLLRQWGGGTISWMTTWPENRHMITADGRSYIAFVRHAGVAVVLGDPIGPADALGATMNDFVALCDRAGMVPYIFSCTESTVAVTTTLGWQSVQVAEDNVIDLGPLEFKGKKWQDIRTALNKAPKEGIRFEMVNLAEQSWRLVGQVQHLSEEWLGDKKLPEMGFTLGGLDEALDPDVKVGLALDEDGVVQGVTSWLPVYGGDDTIVGWTLDLMRRVDGGFRATMEFLIASSCLHFKAEGAQFVSLSGAPLARSTPDTGRETAVDKFLDTLGGTLEPVYGFRSLHHFKSKFQPRLSPLYMVFRDEGDLPRIAVAITRAYLPTAKLRDMLTVVKQ